MADEDWVHVQSETRAGSATLNEGSAPNEADSFEVDGIAIVFRVGQ